MTETQNAIKNEYKGFSLFLDIEDKELRNRNRAVVMTNIAEDNTKAGLINAKGAGLVMGYFLHVPIDEREEVKTLWAEQMKQRGFKLEQPSQ